MRVLKREGHRACPLSANREHPHPASELFANSRTGLFRFHSCSRRNKDWCFLICVSISLNAFLQPARTFFPLPVARNFPVGRDNVNASDCKKAFSEIETQIKKHQSLLRR